VDVRKPVHAVTIGALLALIAAPVLSYLDTEAHYRLQADQTKVISHASTQLGNMLIYDKASDAVYFNKDGQSPAGDDSAMTKVGSGSSKQVYAAKMPTKAGAGIKLTDTQHQVSATMTPQYTLMDGRKVGGRMLYPMQDQPGVLALTPKGNGVKEDIVLNGAPADRVQYDYKLSLDDGLEARLGSNGAIGVWSGDPALFGNITYSSDADRAKVEAARKNADKTYLMFEIPAPVVKQTDGKSHGVKAHFVLKGDTLSVVTTGLSQASYPLSIDPSFVITSQSDFLLGKIEDNITLTQTSGSDYQLNRAKITAGLLGSWGTAVAGNLPTTGGGLGVGCGETGGVNFNFGLTAYNGFLYLVGGGNGANRFVCYAALNANGTLGTWTPASSEFATGRIGSTVVGFNGYLYVIDGEDSTGNTQYKQVEFAPVTSTGDITAAWTNSSSYYTGTAHTFGAGVTYNGFIYMCGGATAKKDASLIATCEYTQINSDGTLQKPSTSCTLSGTATNWCTTSSFTTARNRFGMAAYNGYLYIVGGYNGTTPITGSHSLMYSSIAADYTLGTWTDNATNFTTVTGLTSGWRNGGVVAEEGHLYMVGGCTTAPACSASLNSAYYAVLNADGTIGSWDTSTTFTTARFFNGVASYNGVVYSIGGCTVEPTNANNCTTALGDSQYAIVNTTPGDTTGTTSGATISASRAGVASLAYNGYLYAAGGCNGTNCGTYVTTTDVAKVNDDGSLTWTTTGTLPAPTGMNAGRTYGSLVGYGGKIYYVGGLEKTTAPADHYASNVLVGTQTVSTGAISWAADNTAGNAFANGRAYGATAQWGNYIYVLGGYDGTNYYHDVQYTKIVSGTLTDPNSCGGGTTVWCSTSSWGGTGERGIGAASYAGYLYVGGGRNGTTAATTVYRASITNSTGALGSFSTETNSLPSGPHSFMGMVIHNNVIYALGGMTDNTGNAPSNVISCAALDGSTGAVGVWTTCSRTLGTARWSPGVAAYNGRLFVVGGCTSTGVPPCSAYSNSAEFFTVRNGGNGMFGTTAANTNPWIATSGCSGSCSMTLRADFQTVAYNSNLYTIGGCTVYTAGACTTWSTKVEHAAINADGSLGTFSSASDAQLTSGQARTNGALIAYVGRIFLIGGSSSTNADTADVISAPLTATGNVDTTQGWRTETSMPEARHGFGASISSGRMYVAGGINGANYRNTVMYSEIGENGVLINWTTDNTHTFVTGRAGHSTVAYNSVLYVIAGVDSSGNALGDIQYATINSDGSLGNWSYTNYQDQFGKFRQAAAANGYMYFFGSETSGNDVFYAAINSNGSLGKMYRASNSGMINVHPHGGAVFADGFFYAVGGCTLSGANCTTVNNNAEYAGQKAQARIGHYSKMFNTEVNTSPTLVQVNGVGQFIITLRTEAVGTTVWGVPQFISPAYASKFYFIQALDSSGTNVGIAFNYYLFLIIDDSNTGTFPDTASSATDVDIFYHPNPARRLRHGASFTNTGCNGVIANGCLLDTAQ